MESVPSTRGALFNVLGKWILNVPGIIYEQKDPLFELISYTWKLHFFQISDMDMWAVLLYRIAQN